MAAGFPDAAVGRRLLCIDFDGTITQDDVLFTLIKTRAKDGWQVYEQAWRGGEMSSLECMRGELGFLEISREALDEFVDSIPLDPHFAGFAREAEEVGFALSVVSDGLDYYIARILKAAALDHLPFSANRTIFRDDGRIDLEAPYPDSVRDQAGNYKSHFIREKRRQFDHVTMIGDGLSDRGAAAAADLVFAKGELAEACEQRGIEFRRFATFADLLPLLPPRT